LPWNVLTTPLVKTIPLKKEDKKKKKASVYNSNNKKKDKAKQETNLLGLNLTIPK